MSEPNFLIALFIVSIATIYSYLLSKLFKIELKAVKFETIDGLRGYLAFFVFLHHACVYYYFLPAYDWRIPPQNLFVHFGQTSVAMFFMITGFLFFDKLISSRHKTIDWKFFFLSRFLRIYPLYLFIFPFILLVVAIMTHFQLYVSYSVLFEQIKQWLLFAIFESPPINNLNEVNGITAGVLWSLKYEWIFYFLLPVLALLFFKQRPTIYVLIISIFLVYTLCTKQYTMYSHFYGFLYGLAAALLYRVEKIKKVLSHWSFSIVAISLLIALVHFFHEGYMPSAQILTGIAFIIIACGNSIFGILTLKASKAIGQLAYSIYLIHGIILSIFFRLILGHKVSSSLSLYQYWFTVLGVGILLITICYFTYYKIELPSMKSTQKVLDKFQSIRRKINSFYLKKEG